MKYIFNFAGAISAFFSLFATEDTQQNWRPGLLAQEKPPDMKLSL